MVATEVVCWGGARNISTWLVHWWFFFLLTLSVYHKPFCSFLDERDVSDESTLLLSERTVVDHAQHRCLALWCLLPCHCGKQPSFAAFFTMGPWVVWARWDPAPLTEWTNWVCRWRNKASTKNMMSYEFTYLRD